VLDLAPVTAGIEVPVNAAPVVPALLRRTLTAMGGERRWGIRARGAGTADRIPLVVSWTYTSSQTTRAAAVLPEPTVTGFAA
jgi:hypothetical protein